jgi:DNA ligase-1
VADYIIQKAVSPDKVVKKRKVSLEYMGEYWIAQRKYDGCCAVLVGGQTLSRTGEVYQCLNDIAQEFYPGLVVIGEAWWPGPDQFNLISGEFRRHARSEKLELKVNDVLTLQEFNDGYSPVPYMERMARIPDEGFRWSKAATIPGPIDPQAKCNELVDLGGYDGLILRDPAGTWTRGNGTTGEIIKIKRVLSFDLRVTGVWGGEGKHAGRLGAIGVNFRGKVLRVGTGFTDKQREDWWGDPSLIVGKIVEVEAMDYSSDGLLREPRFKGIRFDKAQPDA